MNISVFLNGRLVCGFSRNFFENVFKNVLSNAVFNCLHDKNITVNVAGVSIKEIERLNKRYRDKCSPTDVLSFGNYRSFEDIWKESHDTVDIGEIVLCCDIIDKASREDGVSMERELVFIVSHGFLHLLGFDHSPEMFALQDKACDELT